MIESLLPHGMKTESDSKCMEGETLIGMVASVIGFGGCLFRDARQDASRPCEEARRDSEGTVLIVRARELSCLGS